MPSRVPGRLPLVMNAYRWRTRLGSQAAGDGETKMVQTLNASRSLRPDLRSRPLSRYAGAGLAGVIAAVAALGTATAEEKSERVSRIQQLGKQEFEYHCVVCHGESGKGDGEMAKVLVRPPADLTMLAKKNDNEFPFWRVYAVIGGEASVVGHQPFEMPGFWRRFRSEESEYVLPAEMRILVLTHYVESLQK